MNERDDYNEWAAEHLLDQDDMAAWRQERYEPVSPVSDAECDAWFADSRFLAANGADDDWPMAYPWRRRDDE